MSIYIYETYAEDPNKELIATLWKVISGLLVFSMLNFALFLKLINREYWTTFFTTITGKQYVVKNYKEADSDEMRFDVFTHNRNFYDPIQEDIMKWLNSNWEKWEDEAPDWFNSIAISGSPSDLLPIKVFAAMGGTEVGRRASLEAMKKTEDDEKAAKAATAENGEGVVVPADEQH